MFKLLSTANPKIQKSTKFGYLSFILHLAPAKLSGKETCPKRTEGCTAACLNTAGRGGMFKPGFNTNTIQLARIRKTNYFFNDRTNFMLDLKADIERAIVYAKKLNLIPVFRLNGTSDIAFEKYDINGKTIFELFPDVQFYDYTKNYLRFDKVLPSNYHLTFSRSETNEVKAMELLKRGFNVAMVFDKLPSTYQGYEVINADLDDLRFLDKQGVICGLKYKNMTGKGGAEKNKQAFESGFIVLTENVLQEVA